MEWVIDSDAHVTESPGVWIDRLPAKWRDLAPRMVRDETGEDYWYVGGERSTGSVGASAFTGSGHKYPDRPRNFDECPLPSWNANERLRLMDEEGIWAQVIYPNVGGFGNEKFLNMRDPELQYACVRAYNDWVLEWCSEDPNRLLAVASLPIWNVEECVAEIERCTEAGHRAVLFTGEPQRFTNKYFGDAHWDPLYRAASECNMPINFHLGTGNMEAHWNDARRTTHGHRATAAQAGITLFLQNAIQVVDFLLSGVLPRFPGLKVVSVESGVGWLPFVLDAADRQFQHYDVGIEHPGFDGLPSDYFRGQMYACYIYEEMPLHLVETVGADSFLFETDYPHPVCLYGNVQKVLEESHKTLPNDIKRKLVFDNAAKLYRVPPAPPIPS